MYIAPLRVANLYMYELDDLSFQTVLMKFIAEKYTKILSLLSKVYIPVAISLKLVLFLRQQQLQLIKTIKLTLQTLYS